MSTWAVYQYRDRWIAWEYETRWSANYEGLHMHFQPSVFIQWSLIGRNELTRLQITKGIPFEIGTIPMALGNLRNFVIILASVPFEGTVSIEARVRCTGA